MLHDAPFMMKNSEILYIYFMLGKRGVTFNIFEAMKHRAESPKCYWIDVVVELVEDNSREPQPTQPMEKAIVNSIESCDRDEDLR